MIRFIKERVPLIVLITTAFMAIFQFTGTSDLYGDSQESKNVDLLIIIDQSKSMDIKDPDGKINKYSQFITESLAKYSTDILKKHSKEQSNHRMGIIIFGVKAELVLKLTSVKDVDLKKLKLKIEEKETDKTNFSSALEAAYKEFKDKNSFDENRDPQILIVTDGKVEGKTGDSRESIEDKDGKLIEIDEIGKQFKKFKEMNCQVNVVIVGDNVEDVNVWKDFIYSTDGLFYVVNKITDTNVLENKCDRIFSKILKLYSIKLHLPKSTMFERNQIFIKATILSQNSIVIDPSINLRLRIRRPNEIIDTLNITSNKKGFFISDYLENPETGDYSLNMIIYDNENILSEVNEKFNVNKIKTGMFGKLVIIVLIFVLVILSVYLFKERNRYKKGNVGKYFKHIEDNLNKSVEDKEGTKKILKEFENKVDKVEKDVSTIMCLAIRNFYFQEDKEGEIVEIKEYLGKGSMFKKGIGYGISFNLLLMLLQAKEKDLLVRLYDYLIIGIDLEVLHHAKEFLESSDFDYVISISKEILEAKDILKDIDGETLNGRKEEIKIIFNIYCNLFEISKINIKSKLRDVINYLKTIDRNISLKDIITEIYESVYNSFEPKFWEGYFPFVIGENLTFTKIVDIEGKLPEHLKNIALSLFDFRDKQVFPIEDFKDSINNLEKTNESSILPEKNVIEILINTWKDAIKEAFILSDGTFDSGLQPKIQVNLITRKIPTNSVNYKKRYNKRNPIYFELINVGKGIVRNLRISISSLDSNGEEIVLYKLNIDKIDRLTSLYEGLIYNFDVKIINSNENKKKDLFFHIEYDDIQKANNILNFRNSIEFFEVKLYSEIVNPFNIEIDKDIIEEITKVLKDNKMMQVINLWGQPKIGKTSTIKQLIKSIGNEFISIYNNFNENEVNFDCKSFWYKLKINLLESIKLQQPPSSLNLNCKENDSIGGIIDFMKLILDNISNSLKFIIILDDFELYFNKIIDEKIKYTIISGLKDILNSNDRIYLLLSGTHCFNEYDLYPLLKPLKSFDGPKTKEFLLKLVSSVHIEETILKYDLYSYFNELAIRKVINVANGNPYYLIVLFNKLIGLPNTNKLEYITQSEVKKMIDIEIKINVIDDFWQKLSYEEKLIILALNDVSKWEQSATLSEIAFSLKQYSINLKPILTKLDIHNLLNVVEFMVKKDIINKKYGRYSISIKLLNDKIKRNIDKFERNLKR